MTPARSIREPRQSVATTKVVTAGHALPISASTPLASTECHTAKLFTQVAAFLASTPLLRAIKIARGQAWEMTLLTQNAVVRASATSRPIMRLSTRRDENDPKQLSLNNGQLNSCADSSCADLLSRLGTAKHCSGLIFIFWGEVNKGCKKSEVLDMELHVDMPRPFLQEGADVLVMRYLGEAAVLLHWDSSFIGLTASKPKVAAADLDFLAEHVGPEELTFIGAELTLGEGSQFQDEKHAEAVLYFDVLVVVDAPTVGAAADYAQPLTLHFLPNPILLFLRCFLQLLEHLIVGQLMSGDTRGQPTEIANLILQKRRGSLQDSSIKHQIYMRIQHRQAQLLGDFYLQLMDVGVDGRHDFQCFVVGLDVQLHVPIIRLLHQQIIRLSKYILYDWVGQRDHSWLRKTVSVFLKVQHYAAAVAGTRLFDWADRTRLGQLRSSKHCPC